jgi:UDPglucose 6-dehydrogenase
MRVSVIGCGYVGLVAGACFADAGNDVVVMDIDEDKIAGLAQGHIPIFEPGLAELVQSSAKAGRLSFTTDTSAAVSEADVVFLAVGTPSAPDGAVDMQYVEAAATAVGKALTRYTVLVNKSTVPVGTQKRVTELVRAVTKQPFDVVSNPEFLKEGAALADFHKPDRVVIGSESPRAIEIMRTLYAPFMRREERLLVMDPASAELTKYACNAMLATRISFMNELARLCDVFGADIHRIRRGMGTDRRIGPDFLYASLGYGGSCFPKDVQALMTMGHVTNQPMRIVTAVHQANVAQREAMFARILHHFGGSLHGKRLGVWGLAFKAKTDDVRDSAAITVVQRLIGAGAEVVVHDPAAIETARVILGTRATYAERMYDAVEGVDALVVCTEWQEYRMPDLARLESTMRGNVIFDGRNLYDIERFRGTGLHYFSIGRPAHIPE